VIKVDWTILLQAANFFFLMGALHLILFRPLGKIMQGRHDEINGNLQQAGVLEEQISKDLAAYQEKLQQAKIEIANERKQFRQDVTTEAARMLGLANEEAAAELQAIKDRVVDEKEQALVELKTQAVPLAARIAEKVVGRAI
jgi:F-type H+-transporting ATPase subunit b